MKEAIDTYIDSQGGIEVQEFNIEPGKVIGFSDEGPIIKTGTGAVELMNTDSVLELKIGDYL